MTNVTCPDLIVGRAVRALREAAGMTQAELGRDLKVAGWRSGLQSAVADLERGKRRVGWEDLLLLGRVLEVPPQCLLVVRGTPDTIILVGHQELSLTDWYNIARVNEEDRAIFRTRGLGGSRVHTPRQSDRRRMAKGVVKRREKQLAQRAKPAGPTFVAKRELHLLVPLEWGAVASIKLKAGAPYAARDRLEAEVLQEAERRGQIERIDRHEARRLRKQFSVSRRSSS